MAEDFRARAEELLVKARKTFSRLDYSSLLKEAQVCAALAQVEMQQQMMEAQKSAQPVEATLTSVSARTSAYAIPFPVFLTESMLEYIAKFVYEYDHGDGWDQLPSEKKSPYRFDVGSAISGLNMFINEHPSLMMSRNPIDSPASFITVTAGMLDHVVNYISKYIYESGDDNLSVGRDTYQVYARAALDGYNEYLRENAGASTEPINGNPSSITLSSDMLNYVGEYLYKHDTNGNWSNITDREQQEYRTTVADVITGFNKYALAHDPVFDVPPEPNRTDPENCDACIVSNSVCLYHQGLSYGASLVNDKLRKLLNNGELI